MEVNLVSKTVPNKEYFDRQLEKLDLPPQEDYTSEQLMIYIARVSSSRDNKLEDIDKLLNYLIDEGHWSPFEHAYITIEMTTSRAIGRQEIRHRSKTFQEFSQRYSEVTEFEDFELREQPKYNRQSSKDVIATACPNDYKDENINKITRFINEVITYQQRTDYNLTPREISKMFAYQVELSRRVYNTGLEFGVASESARFVLPECSQTVLYSTGSVRSWIHWLELRDSENSQKEIREIAQEVGKIFQQEFPVISNALDFDYNSK